jgi:hypothetical protein
LVGPMMPDSKIERFQCAFDETPSLPSAYLGNIHYQSTRTSIETTSYALECLAPGGQDRFEARNAAVRRS